MQKLVEESQEMNEIHQKLNNKFVNTCEKLEEIKLRLKEETKQKHQIKQKLVKYMSEEKVCNFSGPYTF